MAKLAREIYRRLFLRDRENLVAFDDVYDTMARLLAGVDVTGILDAGASDGRVTKKLLRCFPKATAYGFEPNVPQYGEAWRTLTAEDKRLRIEHAALADEEGELELHVAQGVGPTSLFRPGPATWRCILSRPPSNEWTRSRSSAWTIGSPATARRLSSS